MSYIISGNEVGIAVDRRNNQGSLYDSLRSIVSLPVRLASGFCLYLTTRTSISETDPIEPRRPSFEEFFGYAPTNHQPPYDRLRNPPA